MNQQSEKELQDILESMCDDYVDKELGMFDVYLHEVALNIDDIPDTLKAYGMKEHELLEHLQKAIDSLEEVRRYVNGFRDKRTSGRIKGKW